MASTSRNERSRSQTGNVSCVKGASKAGADFHIPSLDGIRTVAFSLVFLNHFQEVNPRPELFESGEFGVTVFFFLSGYLIATLLRREFETTSTIDFRKFYLRRFLRIVPPMYTMIATAYLLSISGLSQGAYNWRGAASQMAFFTNYSRIFDHAARIPEGTGVLWSLAVEEHFYVVFPLVAYLLFRKASQKTRAKALLAACLLVFLWRAFLVTVPFISGDHIQLATDTRIDSILFGCLMALYCNPVMDKRIDLTATRRRLMYGGSIALLIVSVSVRNAEFRNTIMYSIQGIALAPLFYLAITQSDKSWFRPLNWRWMKFVGLLSYSLYLIHHVATHFVHTQWPDHSDAFQIAMSMGLSFIYALTVYYVLEKPLAKLRSRFRPGVLESR